MENVLTNLTIKNIHIHKSYLSVALRKHNYTLEDFKNNFNIARFEIVFDSMMYFV